MSEKSSSFVKSLIVFITIASFGIYIYEVFFQNQTTPAALIDKRPEHSGHREKTGDHKAQELYLEAKELEIKNKTLPAYEKYETIIEIYKQTSVAKEARKRLQGIKTELSNEIEEWINSRKTRKIAANKDLIEKIFGADQYSQMIAKSKQKKKK